MSDRLIIHTVHTDDGATELYFGRTEDDHPGPGQLNTVQFGKDGSLVFKAWTDNEQPYVTTICDNRTVVCHTENMLTMEEINAGQYGAPEIIVFDSAEIKGWDEG